MDIFRLLSLTRLSFCLSPLLIGALSASDTDVLRGPPISVQPPPSSPSKKTTLVDQTQAQVEAKSSGCLQCHEGSHDPHQSTNVRLGCTDCHGGDAHRNLDKEQAHIHPKFPELWQNSANPVDSSVLLNHESTAFIRFFNPGDLRVADETCGSCHMEIVENVMHSMMNHGAMLWGAALYNNGSIPLKNYAFGQAYGKDGAPLILKSPIPVTPEDTKKLGIVPYLAPAPTFHVSQTANIFRIFEKGGEKPLELGLPNPFEPPGRPIRRLSERGLGTLTRTDPLFLGFHKTRLHDPLLGFLGSNNQPGDYRSSGCTSCHMVYANDRSPTNSGWYSKYGHQGLSFSSDPAIPKNEKGHPIDHVFTRSIPSSQCMTCHIHVGNNFVNPYLGYTLWDKETDGSFMYPKEQKTPTEEETLNIVSRVNPQAAAARGLWGDLDFLEHISELNPKLKHTQFADYHGRGWIMKAVFKKDKEGNLLDKEDQVIPFDDPEKFSKAVHLKDIHLEKGMQCVDCHFDTDVHGSGLLHQETRAATTIECIDCHGTVMDRPSLITSGVGGKVHLATTSTPWGPRFYWEGTKLFQRSMMSPDLIWEIPQTIDTVTPGSGHYNPASAYAKTLTRDGSWGSLPSKEHCPESLAHSNDNISCQVCHSSWATSCFGCHLPMKVNQKVATNKYEGTVSRNFTTWNPQVVREDVYMLGKDGTVKDNRMAILRSSSAVLVSSQSTNREWLYTHQQTVSAEGYSGQAFNPHFPHTTSGAGTTKNCTDCHLSARNDNNAWMTQLLGMGTGTVNFFGRFAYVAAGPGGLYAVVWTEREEPQAVIGSSLQKVAYPNFWEEHQDHKQELQESYHHGNNTLDLQLRGEYLYAARGENGFEVFDVANIDHKGFSERIVTSPVSPLGQQTHIQTPYATSVVLPSTLMIDPNRTHLPENLEQPIHPLYKYAFVTDHVEGLILVDVSCLFDGDPENNFLEKTLSFNPDGLLKGANHAFVAGSLLYIVSEKGLYVVDIDDPLKPKIVGSYDGPFLKNARKISIQFRYAFITDEEGLKVFDITQERSPQPVATLPLNNANGLYLARTYAYIANGSEGLAVVDIQNPEAPKLQQSFTAKGQLSDVQDVKIGSVHASMYALVANGKQGLSVVQLISPDTVPGAAGFSPPPSPQLIATFPTEGRALAISRGLDRDRIVDETGNQTVVFGRVGSRPFNKEEREAFLKKHDGELFFVEDVYNRGGKLINQQGEELPRAYGEPICPND